MMRAFWIVLWAFSFSLIAAIYAYSVKPELVTKVFIEKITSPAGLFTGMIFIVGTFGVIWKRIKLAMNLKGE